MNDETLLWKFNRIRQTHQLYYLRSLPKGVMSNCSECVWARVLSELDPNVYVSSDLVEIDRRFAISVFEEFGVSIQPANDDFTRVVITLGDEARKWLEDFDSKRKPLLIGA